MAEVIVIGAGPCGLAAAIALQDAGFDPIIIEKYNIVHSIFRYPTNLQFFSTPDRLEIGGYPFPSPNDKPSRQEALEYYRTVAQRRKLRIQAYEEVTSIHKGNPQERFKINTLRNGQPNSYEADYVVLATGYFDRPNTIGIPGEDLPHVSHYFMEAHPYAGMKVAIIGGNNSAVDAAMELHRVGSEVTIVYRRGASDQKIKPWVRPAFDALVSNGSIRMEYHARIIDIKPGFVTIQKEGVQETEQAEADFVLALTGFRPDRTLLGSAGAEVKPDTGAPIYNPETMETSVKGLYVAGVVASGEDANEVFIETGRYHGNAIAQHLIATGQKQGS